MATELKILAWCDACLEKGKNTPGETLTVDVTGAPAYDVEVCPTHARGLLEAVAALSVFGRPVGQGVPKVPDKATRTRRPQELAAGDACPECLRPYATRGALRAHLRDGHDKSLADVGLAPANFECPDCHGKFDTPQGLGVHVRSHAKKAG